MSYYMLQVEETPRYEGAALTTPYRVSTEKFFFFPATSANINPGPGPMSRDNEMRGVYAPIPMLKDTFAPTASLSENAYLNNVALLMYLAGFDATIVTGDGVNEVQTLSLTGAPTGGSFTITYDTETTNPIAYNARAKDVQRALEQLSNIATGDVHVTGGPLDTAIVITFGGALASQSLALMTTTDSLTGGTAPATSIAETTDGVAATAGDDPRGVGVPTGAYLLTFTKAAGATARSAQIIGQYDNDANVWLKGQGFGVNSLTMDVAGAVTASMLGLFVDSVPDPSETPAYDAPAIAPARRGDFTITWNGGSATCVDGFSLSVNNPIEAADCRSVRSFWPVVLENTGPPVIVSGSVSKRQFYEDDWLVMIEQDEFAAEARWITDTQIGTSGATYAMWMDAPSVQHSSGGPEDLTNTRRIASSFDWQASLNAGSGYDVEFNILCAISSLATFA